jgi:hypothetical protein
MEIERLPLSQSLADKHRAAELKWRGKPPGIPPEMAIEFVAKLKAGSTVRKLTGGGRILGPAMVSYDRFKKHCELNPEWAVEALRISDVNSRLGKGARLRNRTHCRNGHPLADAFVSHQAGYTKRDCRSCWRIRQKQAPPIKPEVARKVEILLRRGSPISSFTTGGSKSYLVEHKTFTRFRLENPQINELFLQNRKTANSRGQGLRYLRIKNSARREEANDYQKILAMFPLSFPGRHDAAQDVFVALLEGSLKRVDVPTRVQQFMTAHNRMFPTKYAKFGDSPLLSLDEALFDDGTATRADAVSRGLWD